MNIQVTPEQFLQFQRFIEKAEIPTPRLIKTTKAERDSRYCSALCKDDTECLNTATVKRGGVYLCTLHQSFKPSGSDRLSRVPREMRGQRSCSSACKDGSECLNNGSYVRKGRYFCHLHKAK